MKLRQKVIGCGIPPSASINIDIRALKGHDLHSLLYSFMDEFLFNFSTEFIVSKEVEITEWDTENFKIKATGCGFILSHIEIPFTLTIRRGETFDLEKHPQGTEVKVSCALGITACDTVY